MNAGGWGAVEVEENNLARRFRRIAVPKTDKLYGSSAREAGEEEIQKGKKRLIKVW